MALHNMDLYQKGKKLSGVAFKELLKVLDRCGYQTTSMKTVREVKKLDCLKDHFRISDEALRDK